MESKTVTAVILGHENKEKLFEQYKSLMQQTHKPDQIIMCACCMDICDMTADIRITDDHVDDIGQRFCDWGLRLASCDYTFFASSDDVYERDWIEKMLQTTRANPDLVLGGFDSHLVGRIEHSTPVIGAVTRGSFLVRTKKGQAVGYNGREYSSDGQFIKDIVESGGTWVGMSDVLYRHN